MGFSQLPDVRAAEEEVRRSMELVEQVGELMSYRSKGKMEGLEIVGKVLNSLTTALVLLHVSDGEAVKEEGGESAWTAGSHCSESMGGKPDGRRRGRGAAAAKKGGGRRRSHPYSCKKTTCATVNDGFTWRKYGQKDIQSSKYPRSYFRCTYKYSKECKAIKQVQICEDDPSSFLITYIGQHTCRPIPASVADDAKHLPEPGEASPRPESVITTVVEQKLESYAGAADRVDCRDSEEYLWSDLELHIPEPARSSPLSSSSIYGGDMGMFSTELDISGFLDFTGSSGA